MLNHSVSVKSHLVYIVSNVQKLLNEYLNIYFLLGNWDCEYIAS